MAGGEGLHLKPDCAAKRTAGKIAQAMTAGTFVRNGWYVAAWAHELAIGGMLSRTILGEPVVLFRKTDGSVAALEDRCPHRFAPLSAGTLLNNGVIQCGYHGLEIDSTGACVRNPHNGGKAPSGARVAQYTIAEKHSALWIWMGDRPADWANIPDFGILDNVPAFAGTKLDSIHVAANYKLIVDNLLDLSHVAFLHGATLGNPASVGASLEVTEDGDDLLVSRHVSNVAPAKVHQALWPYHPERVDSFNRMRWMAPSALKLFVGVCDVGAPWESGSGFYALHLLTPESERSTHYFFTAVRFGMRTTGAELNRHLQDTIAKTRRHAFEFEDAPVIEAQQRTIDQATRPLEPAFLSVDAGAVRFRRAIQRLEDAE
jgi:phenylpropionate dioxygenase-like ring-hydroxylating dioxygenase large terminal subunit